MKIKFLPFLIVLFSASFGINAQNCNYSYTFNPGLFNVVNFSPNPNFSPNIYHFVWDFNDGTSSTSPAPIHTFNSLPPYVVCYDIFDSSNVRICTACDSVSSSIPPNCTFTYQQTSGLVVFFQAPTNIGSTYFWSIDSLTTVITGNPVTYVFQNPGVYNVCVLEIEVATGDTLCSFCNPVNVIPNTGSCNFTYNNHPTSNNTYDFYANVNPGSTVSWDFGDNFLGNGPQVIHTYLATGGYTVCMTATDSNGTTCTYCDSILVGPQIGNCYFTYAPDSNGVNSFSFFGSPAYPGNTINWNFGDGTLGSGYSVSHSYNPGTYTVCINETDSAGLLVCSSCNTVYVANTGNCYFNASTNPLNNLTIDFQAYSGLLSTVTWDFGDSTFATGPSASHTYAAPGVYQVCITVSGSGAICTSCQFVTAGNSTSPCQISYIPDSSPLNGFFFSIQPTSSSSQIAWDFGDGSTDFGNVVHHVYVNGGVYTVCVIERDSSQNVVCQSCIALQVGNSANCQASYIATSLGLTAYFIDLSPVNPASTSYSWDFGDGTTSTNRFPQHTYAAPGLYTACLSIVSGNCANTYCNTIQIDSTIINPTGCQAFYAIVQIAPYQVTVVNLSSGVNLNFLWDFGDGTTDTQPYPSHYYTSIGTYNLCLTVSDGLGCSNTFCDTLTVDSLGNIFRSMAGFTINVLSPSQLTGVNEIKTTKSFKVYPNPVTTELKISIISGAEKAIAYRLMSIQGSEVLKGKLNNIDGKVNVQSLKPGTYLLEITSSNGTKYYQNIIKN